MRKIISILAYASLSFFLYFLHAAIIFYLDNNFLVNELHYEKVSFWFVVSQVLVIFYVYLFGYLGFDFYFGRKLNYLLIGFLAAIPAVLLLDIVVYESISILYISYSTYFMPILGSVAGSVLGGMLRDKVKR